MCSAWVHVTVKVDCPYETAKLFDVGGWLKIQDWFNFLGPGFKASRSKPITKPISLLDCPFAFKRVDGETIVL